MQAIFTVADLNYTAAAPGPADAVSADIAIPPLTTNATVAAEWYQNLMQEDVMGRTIICYGIYRFYSDDIANIGVPIMQLLLAVRPYAHRVLLVCTLWPACVWQSCRA